MGFNDLYREGHIKEATCWGAYSVENDHSFWPVNANPGGDDAEALRRIGELYGIEADIRGKNAAERLVIRQEKTVPLLNALQPDGRVPGFHAPSNETHHKLP